MDRDYWLQKAAQHLEKAANSINASMKPDAETLQLSEHHRALAATMIQLAGMLEIKAPKPAPVVATTPVKPAARNSSPFPDRPVDAPQNPRTNAISNKPLEPSTASFDQLGS